MSTPAAGPSVLSAVVTGAARGIGRAVAEKLVQRGYAVVVTDVDGAGAEQAAAEIGAVAGLAQDVRSEASHATVAAEAARHGRLAVWVNNAGVGHDGALADLPSDQVDRLVDVNLKGALWGTRAALAGFGPAGGDVVNIASLSGLGPVPGLSTYAATKAAVVSLTMSVQAETPDEVRVHALCPDGVDTEMVATMRDDGLAKALVRSGGRLLSVDEVAAEAVGLVGGHRVVRTLPAWRGGVMRGSSLLPSLAQQGIAVFAKQGRAALRRN
ncbi:SDR family oxidoreductase [Nocardioides perillae]|uniref:NAD(P)-dependent dehydrogenase (Short-subunit alcohol dehydrogenase family) n=1 Tax=Nocardioides perillae TaxID=1119534 RepID=A0A7Y9UV22_9ACTN|nr:SDR family oxidoreductase [Nocardioides perillae]NYG54930.1 NAD(P)-dependent dehydrogenase (short-subunit alcohol dehydrogenase family) [Nocardioides perillae]